MAVCDVCVHVGRGSAWTCVYRCAAVYVLWSLCSLFVWMCVALICMFCASLQCLVYISMERKKLNKNDC